MEGEVRRRGWGWVGGLGLFCVGRIIPQELLLVLECWINHWRVMSAETEE